MGDLLKQFVTEECTPYVRGLLEEALGDPAKTRRHFEFNRFEVTVEHEENIVVVQDVIDGTAAGIERVPFAEFIAALVLGIAPVHGSKGGDS